MAYEDRNRGLGARSPQSGNSSSHFSNSRKQWLRGDKVSSRRTSFPSAQQVFEHVEETRLS